ncbi:flagellin (archaellin), FlaG/FlaF family [Candidatus Methanomarinus sp.]|nr:flagellin (archaellin), FlaG/FlaF family [ANME-2 cluster archaeon]
MKIGKLNKNEEGVSPVIGVILMVAITVILAAVIAAFVFGMGGSLKEAPPSASLNARSNSATPGEDVVIEHTGGETLKGSDWKVSVVEEGHNPHYVLSTSVDDFVVGTQLVINDYETAHYTGNAPGFAGGSWIFTNTNTSHRVLLVSSTKYDVKVVHMPSNSMVLDTVVEVR